MESSAMSLRKILCIVCGKPLTESIGEALQCAYCGRIENSDYSCEEGHYVCESCRTATASELILSTCLNHRSAECYSLANLLMRHPAIPKCGPEHHLIVPAVLLTIAAYSGSDLSLEPVLKQSARRASRFSLGSCASTGVCGAAAGVPIAVSLLIGADYNRPTERATVLRSSATSVAAISALPGQRCCKAAVYSSLRVGVAFIREDMGLQVISSSAPACEFSSVIEECYKDLCPFYRNRQPDSGEGSSS